MCVFLVGAARCRARQGAATGEKHKAKGRKTSVPDVESRLIRKSSTKDADCSRRAAPGRTTKASTEAFFSPTESSPTTAALAATHQTTTKKNTKESVRTLTKHIIEFVVEKLHKMMGFGRQVGAFCRENDSDSCPNRRRCRAKCGGGGRRLVDSRHENDRKAAPFHTHRTSTDSASNSLQDAVVFVRLSAFYAENDRFSCPPRAIRSTRSRAEHCTREIREVLAPQRLRMGGRFAHRWKEREKLRKMVCLPAL